nr:MAG TPA: hypothetical protein [Caudoviricetes sp.]
MLKFLITKPQLKRCISCKKNGRGSGTRTRKTEVEGF